MRWQAAGGDEGVIEHVEPRRNLLFRQDEWKTKSFAANLDQLLVLVAAEPVFSESQLARALIAAESAGIAAAHRAEQDRPARRSTPRASASRPTAAMGVEVHRGGAEGAARTRAARVLAPLLRGQGDAGARARAAPARAR